MLCFFRLAPVVFHWLVSLVRLVFRSGFPQIQRVWWWANKIWARFHGSTAVPTRNKHLGFGLVFVLWLTSSSIWAQSVVGHRDRGIEPLAKHGFLVSVFTLGACRASVGLSRRLPPLLRCENWYALSVDGVSHPRLKTAGVLYGQQSKAIDRALAVRYPLKIIAICDLGFRQSLGV